MVASQPAPTPPVSAPTGADRTGRNHFGRCSGGSPHPFCPFRSRGRESVANLRAPVQAPPARPPRYGLLAAAPTVADDDLRPLAGGWSYQPEGCGNSGISEIACAGNVDVMSPAAQPSTIDGDPVWIWAGDECSTFGFGSRDWEGRARRQLAATESFRLGSRVVGWCGSERFESAESVAVQDQVRGRTPSPPPRARSPPRWRTSKRVWRVFCLGSRA